MVVLKKNEGGGGFHQVNKLHLAQKHVLYWQYMPFNQCIYCIKNFLKLKKHLYMVIFIVNSFINSNSNAFFKEFEFELEPC